MKTITKTALLALAGCALFSSNAFAARNNGPITGPGSTMQPQNRYVQPAPRYTPPPRQYFAQPKFVPAPSPKRPPSCTGAGSLSTGCR